MREPFLFAKNILKKCQVYTLLINFAKFSNI